MTVGAEGQAGRQPHPWVGDGSGKVRFGIAYGPRSDWPTLRSFVELVEGLGFDSYWTMDHPVSGFDAWSSLAAIATVTDRIRIGPLVSCVYYRSPAMLARLAADVDHLSGGRLVLGIGGGNHAGEFERLGIPFAGTAERLAAVEKTLRSVQDLWRDERVRPGPIQQPHVPVLIAGGGERVTLRQVARYADTSNFSPHANAGSAFGADDVRRKLEALRRHCESFGRPYETVLKTHVTVPVVLAESASALAAKLARIPEGIRRSYASSTLGGLPEDVVSYYRELVGAGITYVIAGIYGNDRETVELLAERVMPHFV